MGVKKLKTFMKDWQSSHPDDEIIACVDLKLLANEWRSSGGQPIIIIDGYNILQRLVCTHIDCICGGEYKFIASQVKDFVLAFKDISVDVVFFFDGPVKKCKVSAWLESKYSAVAKVDEAFRNVENWPISEQFVDFPPILFFPVVKEMLSSLCKVVHGIGNTDKEMSKYVIENKCLGIFSEDTDFLVFEGIPHVLSSDHLDLKSMTTKEYRRDVLLRSIQLRSEAMPIFATLMGNDMLEFRDTKTYLKTNYSRLSLIATVTALAQKSNKIYDECCDQKRIVFKLSKIFGFMNNKMDAILESLESYSYLSTDNHRVRLKEWEKIEEVCMQKFLDQTITSGVLSVITQQRMCLMGRFGDSKSSHVTILRELRRRMYRVLLHEKRREDGGSEFVEEVCANFCRNADTKYLISALPVDKVEHPGLLRLWNGKEEVDDQRWKLVWWVLFGADSSVCFEEMSHFLTLLDNLMLEGLTLLYIYVVLKKISMKEITVFMIMIAAITEMNETDLGQYSVEYVKQRTISVATLYQATYSTVRTLMDMVGLQLGAKIKDAYSGLLFHHLVSMEDPIKVLNGMPAQVLENYTNVRNVMGLAGAFKECQTEGYFLPVWSLKK